LLNLASVLERRGLTPEADRVYQQARTILQALVAKQPRNADYQDELGGILYGRARLHFLRCRLEEPFRAGQSILAGASGDWGGYLCPLVLSRADLIVTRDLLREAVPHQRAALDARPRHHRYRKSLYDSLFWLTDHRLRLGDHAEAAQTAVELPKL